MARKRLTQVHMTQDKTTPGTFRYQNDKRVSDDSELVTTIYLRRAAFPAGQAIPGDITLTIEVEGED